MNKFKGTFSDFLVEYIDPDAGDTQEKIAKTKQLGRKDAARAAAQQGQEAIAAKAEAARKNQTDRTPTSTLAKRKADLLAQVAMIDKKLAASKEK